MKLSLVRLLAAVIAAGGLAAPAHAGPSTPDVPSKLVPPDGNKVFLVAHAEGVQIYTCNTATAAWTLVAPRANLYADSGMLIGTHFGGPTWQARDGSFVTATRVDGVNLDPTAVDWLLLKKATTSTDGGRLDATTYIQRIKTTGGRAPAATECDVPGETAEIGYTADYYFWKSTGA